MYAPSGHALVRTSLVALLASIAVAADRPAGKLSPLLLERLADEGTTKTWVFFTDKGIRSDEERAAALADVAASYNPRAVQRRILRGNNALRGGALFDEHDLPVAPAYIDAVTATGAKLHIVSRWVNAVSVWADRAQVEQIAALPFVDRCEAVARVRRVEALNVREAPVVPQESGGQRTINYGNSTAQLNQLHLPELHDLGYTGEGVIIGILDTGFKRTHQAFNDPAHPLVVLAEWDFVDNDGNTAPEPGDPADQHSHGTMILGCIGAYKPGALVGGAFDAQFVLAKTEDVSQEVPAEEDNFVAGLEFHEAHGVDMTTASLGYIDWYTQADMDGQTCVTSIAMNIHTANGVHHTNAAGNEYHDSNPNTSSLIAPADAFQCITCGAVDSSGTIAYFSSDGPTADGRVKPEVCARGVSTHTVSPSSNTAYTTADGTSLSTPLVACVVACLVQAKPTWTVDQMRQNLFETSSYYVQHGTYDPLYVYGYGIVNAFAAYSVVPTPPQVENVNLTTGVATAVSIELPAIDDGEPPPPALTFTLLSLPIHGTLTDPAAGLITAAPYTLANGGNAVLYTPGTIFAGTDSFEFKANDGGQPPEGGDSNVATVTVSVLPEVSLVYSFPLDTDPGWTTEDLWAFGPPLGAGSHSGDPFAGHTGPYVYGYNLAGDYSNDMPRRALTTPALDFTRVSDIQLRYWDWLAIEDAPFDQAAVELSADGANWSPIWQHIGPAVSPTAWSLRTATLSPAADDEPAVYVRWVLGPTDATITYPGWNIDDVEVWGRVAPALPAAGDMDCDGALDFADINLFVLALTDPAAYAIDQPGCDVLVADVNDNGSAGFDDINPFVALFTGR